MATPLSYTLTEIALLLEERARYQYDQDKDMTVLRFDDSQGNARGFLSFLAVHGTSLYNVCASVLIAFIVQMFF